MEKRKKTFLQIKWRKDSVVRRWYQEGFSVQVEPGVHRDDPDSKKNKEGKAN